MSLNGISGPSCYVYSCNMTQEYHDLSCQLCLATVVCGLPVNEGNTKFRSEAVKTNMPGFPPEFPGPSWILLALS